MSVLIGILQSIKFRFNTRNLCPRIHEHPQLLVYISHINKNTAIVFLPSPLLCGAGLFVVITCISRVLLSTCSCLSAELATTLHLLPQLQAFPAIAESLNTSTVCVYQQLNRYCCYEHLRGLNPHSVIRSD